LSQRRISPREDFPHAQVDPRLGVMGHLACPDVLGAL
jgi:hypothetical protein